MRRLVVPILLSVCLLAPASAFGLAGADEDGTLSVRNGVGLVWIKADGALVGRFDHGSVLISDIVEGDGTQIDVWGDERSKEITDQTTRYSGTNLRFRVVGGRFIIKVIATDVDLAAVGQGRFALRGTAGTFARNAGERRALPDELTYYDLGS